MRKERKNPEEKANRLTRALLRAMVEYPEITPNKILVMTMKKETLKNIFTPSRIEVIETIKSQKPKSVGELAKRLDRPVESVSRDLKILENYGILEFIQAGKQKTPTIEKEMLIMPLA